MRKSGLLAMVMGAAAFGGMRAEYLFRGDGSFIEPALDYESSFTRYSEWRNFYSRDTVGNLPDYYATFGGTSPDGVNWYPTPRPTDGSFPESDTYTTPSPNAFWDASNPTITQTTVGAGYISSATASFYGLNGGQTFRLDDNTQASSDAGSPGYDAGTVVFQFQTDGVFVDLSDVRLVYTDETGTHSIYATELEGVELLREYRISDTVSTDPSAAEGYQNRVVVQWDLTGLGISEYQIYWDTAAHTSLQQVSLDTSDTYVAAIPTTRAWTGANGNWTDGVNWLDRSNGATYGSAPVENGNVRFENSADGVITLSGNATVGDVAFATSHDVALVGGGTLTANTGITTTSGATGAYRIETAYAFGALNLFDLAAGTVTLAGEVSGNYGFIKTGNGALVLAGDNTFTGAMDIQGGSIRLEGTNASSALVNVRGGSLVVAAENALAQVAKIKVGADETYFESATPAMLMIDGALTLDRNIEVVANGSQVILGAMNTGSGEATYSGGVALSSGNADVRFRTASATDTLRFSGAITGGGINRTLTIDGGGTVIFSGVAKNYNDATVINSGTLVLDTTIGESAGTGYGQFTVKNGAAFHITSSGLLKGFSGDIFTPASLLTIEEGGRVSGSGVIARKVVTSGLNSVISASREEGALTLASLNASAGVRFSLELGGSEYAGEALIAITGEFKASLTGSGSVGFYIEDLSQVVLGEVYTLVSYGSGNGLDVGDLAILNEGVEVGTWSLEGGKVKVQITAIPEPSTVAMIAAAAGLALAAVIRRRHGPKVHA